MRLKPARSARRSTPRMSEAQYAAYLHRTQANAEKAAPVGKAGKGKYGNEKVFHDGMKFDSKRELRHWLVLVQRQALGLIRDLRRQVPFVLAQAVDLGEKRKKPALRYYADFVYVDVATGETVVEDAKGKKTPEYRTKKHLMMDRHNILVQEV